MIGEIIAIGDELTSGRVLNTNSRFVAGQLFSAGHEIKAMITVRDTGPEIGEALKRSISRADFVIVTGGLGATSDDMTNEAVACALDRPATFHPEIHEKIRSVPAPRSSPSAQTLEKLAWLPEGAEVLKPEGRMAGYLLVHDRIPIFFLPGVPHEMRELLADRVIPRLNFLGGDSARQVRQRVYKIFGLPEIEINDRLKDLAHNDTRVRIGYYPVFCEVHCSLTVISEQEREADDLFLRLDALIQERLGEFIFARDQQTMAGMVGTQLAGAQKRLAVAESCTGGLIGHRITTTAGSSAYFSGGVIAYSNQVKEKLLAVDPAILKQHGAVSSACAKAMAAGVLALTGADIALSVTGIAGPDGGSPEKPVGTVYFGLAEANRLSAALFHFSGDRWQIREQSAMTGLNLVRRHLLNLPSSHESII